jgi:argininosuccinate lyase
MVHLSRLAEEVAWWSNPRFGFVRVADAYSTGSSMMPNKRNPDPAELVRGRTAAAIGAVTGILTLLKGLPLGYQRDLQEDKPPLFRTVAMCESSLAVMSGLLATLAVDRDRMADAAADGYTTATTLADALVRRGVPFRAAHRIVGALVGRAEQGSIRLLSDVPPAAFAELLASSDDETARGLAGEEGVATALIESATIDGSLRAADVIGGTAPARVATAIAAARRRLDGEARA